MCVCGGGAVGCLVGEHEAAWLGAGGAPVTDAVPSCLTPGAHAHTNPAFGVACFERTAVMMLRLPTGCGQVGGGACLGEGFEPRVVWRGVAGPVEHCLNDFVVVKGKQSSDIFGISFELGRSALPVWCSCVKSAVGCNSRCMRISRHVTPTC